MNCDDYLSMLETLPVQELGYGEAREHAAFCHECNRVTRVVAARERNMMMAYAEAYPSASAVTVADRAITTARRRRIAFFYRAGLGIASVAALLFFVAVRRGVPHTPDGALFHERFALQCLSPDQASEVLRREIDGSDHISISARPPLAVIEVQASPRELMRARRILDRFDSPRAAHCAAEVIVPPAERAVEVMVPTADRSVQVWTPTSPKAIKVVPKSNF